MARLQDYPDVTPTSSDKFLVVQSTGQGLVSQTSKMNSANPTGTGTLTMTGNGVFSSGLKINGNQDVATKDSNSTTPYTIRKVGDIVCVRLSATSATFDTDGKTLTVSVPSGFRPYTDAQFYTKIYNGSAYVDCHVIFKSGGTVEISSLSNAAISGANITFLQQTFFTYIST